MTELALRLADRSFEDLVESARSRLPALAPEWTDYNLHDPGITLVELLAWTAEAQIYALARMRRDERAAYARWLGVALSGPQPAEGVIWPDPADLRSPVRAGTRPIVLPARAAIRPEDSDGPVYRSRHDVLIVPGRIAAIVTQRADGTRIDHAATNERGAVDFEPFGSGAGPRDRLQLHFACAHDDGLAGAPPAPRLLLGVRVDDAATTPTDDQADLPPVPLDVTLTMAGGRWPLRVVEDTTAGWLRSGWIALELPRQRPPAPAFEIEIRAPHGFPRAPQVRQLALNVVPVQQLQRVDRETHEATGLPDQRVELNEPGLRSDDARGQSQDPPVVEVQEPGSLTAWRAVDDLTLAGPDDRVYFIERERGAIRFGNGVNGRIPQGRILVSYAFCAGAAGNQARPRAWRAEGLGHLGRSLDAFTGGRDALGLDEARGQARRALRLQRPLVSAQDIADAARAIARLQVERAVAMPAAGDPGAVVLLVMQHRTAGAGATVESRRWLEAVRSALLPRLPLGMRLVVRAPRYLEVRVRAALTAAPRRAPERVRAEALAALASRLDPFASTGNAPRGLGEPLTALDLAAWLRKVDGVLRVDAATLLDARGRVIERIGGGRFDLVRFDAASVELTVNRPATGVGA